MTTDAWREAARAAQALGHPHVPLSPAQQRRLRACLDLPPAMDELLVTGWPTAEMDGLPPPMEPLLAWLEAHPLHPRHLLPVRLEPTVLAVRLDPGASLVRLEDGEEEPTVHAWRSRLVEWARMAPLLTADHYLEVRGERVATPALETALRERFPSEALGEVLRRHGLLSQARARAHLNQAQKGLTHARRALFWCGLVAVWQAMEPGMLWALANLAATVAAVLAVRSEAQASDWSSALGPPPNRRVG